jgi:hypothetical protein
VSERLGFGRVGSRQRHRRWVRSRSEAELVLIFGYPLRGGDVETPHGPVFADLGWPSMRIQWALDAWALRLSRHHDDPVDLIAMQAEALALVERTRSWSEYVLAWAEEFG